MKTLDYLGNVTVTYGLSTDTKGTASNGSWFYEMDNNTWYIYDATNSTWRTASGEWVPLICDNHLFGTVGGGSGGSTKTARIAVAELSGVSIACDTDDPVTSTGGVTNFDVDAGSHTITVTSGDTTLWTATVTAENYKTVYAKGRILNDVSWADIHTACQGGYAQYMFNLKDQKQYIDSNSILNNYWVYIQDFITNGTKTEIQFGFVLPYSGAAYAWNQTFYYLSSDSATSWSSAYSSEGGYKYSTLRLLFMKEGDEPYTQCTSLKSDSATIATGIAWSDYKYSDTKANATFYTYTVSSDIATATEAMTQISAYRAPSTDTPTFVKGYWVNKGTLSETDFNAGIFYTYASNVYTPAASWVSGTTYYGFYEKIQSNGLFYNALSNISSNLATMALKQSPGKTRKYAVQSCEDKVTINSLGELMGQYFSGNISGYVIPRNGDPLAANSHYEGCDGSTWYCQNTYWTRSTYAYTSYYACSMSSFGNVNNYNVYSPYFVRAAFRVL